MPTRRRDPATVDGSLRANGLTPAERDHIVASWGRLDARLRSFAADAVELQLTVKERETPSQRTTLEAWISGRPRLVATSTHTDLDEALTEVREDLIRQIADAQNRREPRNNRALRHSLRDQPTGDDGG